MMVLGLTGSIGMGKSSITRMLRMLRVPVFCADKAVHAIYCDPIMVKKMSELFPGVESQGKIDRNKLTAHLQQHPKDYAKLESLVHPYIRDQEMLFIQKWQRNRRKLVVLDIPLLFESGAHMLCDKTMVVVAPELIQRQRVLKRKAMTPEKWQQIKAKQMPDIEKMARADYVIQTGLDKGRTFRQLYAILRDIYAK